MTEQPAVARTEQEIKEMPVTGLPGRTPREEIEKPRTSGREKEPFQGIDGSGSMEEQAAPDAAITKRELVTQAIPIVTRLLAGEDSQGAHEEGGGGIRSFMFNEPGDLHFDEGEDESDDERDLGDLNEANVQDKLARAPWGGRTYGMPFIHAMERAYQAEFGERPMRNRPTMMGIIWTDGKLSDAREVEEWVRQADETCVLCVAIVGYGNGHDEAVAHYRSIAENNHYVSVVALTGVSDPQEIALDVQLMAA